MEKFLSSNVILNSMDEHIEVYLKNVNGEPLDLFLPRETTVSEVKALIIDILEAQPTKIRLIFAHRILKDDCVISNLMYSQNNPIIFFAPLNSALSTQHSPENQISQNPPVPNSEPTETSINHYLTGVQLKITGLPSHEKPTLTQYEWDHIMINMARSYHIGQMNIKLTATLPTNKHIQITIPKTVIEAYHNNYTAVPSEIAEDPSQDRSLSQAVMANEIMIDQIPYPGLIPGRITQLDYQYVYNKLETSPQLMSLVNAGIPIHYRLLDGTVIGMAVNQTPQLATMGTPNWTPQTRSIKYSPEVQALFTEFQGKIAYDEIESTLFACDNDVENARAILSS